MNIPASRWYQVIEKRRSHRRFETTPLEANILDQINSICNDFRPFPHARAELVISSPDDVFKGIIGSYGKIKGANSFIAFIGNMDFPFIQEQVGYTGEAIILEAEAMGLATCWIGGMFRAKFVKIIVNIVKGERVLSITPIGYATKSLSFEEKSMTGFGLTHKRKSLSDLVSGINESEWPEWMRAALESARLAPSAVNRQPWRFYLEPDSITVSVNSLKRNYGLSKRLCCGIAMLHIEVAALNFGVKGIWEFLSPPQVARFKITSDSI